MKAINIILHGHGPQSPDLAFVEIESDEGLSKTVGTWTKLDDGYWSIRITPEDITNAGTD